MTISAQGPFTIIGERINPTGRAAFAQELPEGELSRVGADAVAQVAAGVDVLDVNAGIPLVDEAALLCAMLGAAAAAVDAPCASTPRCSRRSRPASRSTRAVRSSTP